VRAELVVVKDQVAQIIAQGQSKFFVIDGETYYFSLLYFFSS